MSGSPFDDQVVSLAIANQMRQYARVNVKKEEINDYWSWSYFLRQVTDDTPGKGRYRIGQDYVRSS